MFDFYYYRKVNNIRVAGNVNLDSLLQANIPKRIIHSVLLEETIREIGDSL